LEQGFRSFVTRNLNAQHTALWSIVKPVKEPIHAQASNIRLRKLALTKKQVNPWSPEDSSEFTHEFII